MPQISSITQTHITNIKGLKPIGDCDVLKKVLNTLKDDIEKVLKNDINKFTIQKGQDYVNAIYEKINSIIAKIPGNKTFKFQEEAPTVEQNKILLFGIKGDSVSDSLKEILEPLIEERDSGMIMTTDTYSDESPSKHYDDSGIIILLLKACSHCSGGKSRRRSRKNKRTRKSKKKARRSKKARKTRK